MHNHNIKLKKAKEKGGRKQEKYRSVISATKYYHFISSNHLKHPRNYPQSTRFNTVMSINWRKEELRGKKKQHCFYQNSDVH